MHSRTSHRRFALAALATVSLLGAGGTGSVLAASATPAKTATPVKAAAWAAARPSAATPRNATLATALSGTIRCPLNTYYPELGCGRMRNGKLKLRPGNSPYAHIEIKDIDYGGRRSSVRLMDVAGTRHKEAVVIISANAGGVSWPNYVAVYDGHGKLLTTWDSGAAMQAGRRGEVGGARETTAFSRTTKASVDLRVTGISTGSQAECCGTGVDVYRLSKGKNGKPAFRLITRRN